MAQVLLDSLTMPEVGAGGGNAFSALPQLDPGLIPPMDSIASCFAFIELSVRLKLDALCKGKPHPRTI